MIKDLAIRDQVLEVMKGRLHDLLLAQGQIQLEVRQELDRQELIVVVHQGLDQQGVQVLQDLQVAMVLLEVIAQDLQVRHVVALVQVHLDLDLPVDPAHLGLPHPVQTEVVEEEVTNQ